MSDNVGKVGESLYVMASLEKERQLSALRESLFQTKMSKLKLHVDNDADTITIVDDRITDLQTEISELKKQKTSHHDNNN